MPLVAPHDLYRQAFREGWALGAFNTSNLEVTQGIVWGLKEARAPGIIQVTESAAKYAGLATLLGIIESVAADVPVPIIVHCDHGKSEAHVRTCIDLGFPSVMIDGSVLGYRKNVALTGSVARYAHVNGVWVEGELGVIRGQEGLQRESEIRNGQPGDDGLTNPEQVEAFVKQTEVDALAVSVGTLHGSFQGAEAIRFDRLGAIHAAVPKTPLVLHGASGLPAAELSRAVPLGVAKVNIDTTLRLAFQQGLVKGLSPEEREEGMVDPRKVLAPAREAVQKAVVEAVQVLGSAGKAG